MFNDLLKNAPNYFPQTQAPNAGATKQGINQLRSFASSGGNGAMDVLSQYMNQGLDPNMTNYMNKLGQQMTRQRQQAVSDIGAQFGRGGTSASRLAAEQASNILDQGGANMLNAQMNALGQNAQTRMGAAQGLGNMATSIYGAPSSLEMAMLGNQRAYDFANMGQGAGLAQLLQGLLGQRANTIYDQGTYVGQPDAMNQLLQLLGPILGGAAKNFNPGGLS